jgi:hypothetical protein
MLFLLFSSVLSIRGWGFVSLRISSVHDIYADDEKQLDFRQHRVLRISFWLKLTFILIEVALAIAFGVLGRVGRRNEAAIVEWTIAFVFTLYVISFFIDLQPAVKTKHGRGQAHFGSGGQETELQMERGDGDSRREEMSRTGVPGNGGVYGGRDTYESDRTLGNDVPVTEGGRWKKNRHF